MAKWPNHFISVKQFQKRPNGNPGRGKKRGVELIKVGKNFKNFSMFVQKSDEMREKNVILFFK